MEEEEWNADEKEAAVANDMPISKEKLRSMGVEEEDWTDADEAEAAAEAEIPKQKSNRRRGGCIASKGAFTGHVTPAS